MAGSPQFRKMRTATLAKAASEPPSSSADAPDACASIVGFLLRPNGRIEKGMHLSNAESIAGHGIAAHGMIVMEYRGGAIERKDV